MRLPVLLDPDRVFGPWRLRVWGLIVNLVANALALFGIVAFVERGDLLLLVTGTVLTLACIVILAVPAHAEEDE